MFSTTYTTKLLVIKVKLEVDGNTSENEVDLDLKQFDSFVELLNFISKSINYKIGKQHAVKIFYEGSYVNLIDLKSFYCFISTNLINNKQTLLLIKNKETRNGNGVDFNLEGERFEFDRADDTNRPSMEIYHHSRPEVFCAFCKESSKDEYKLTKVGPFYGPVKKDGKSYYFHELCAIWSPKIALKDNGQLKNLFKEIERVKLCICSYCGIRGGGLGCQIDKCRNQYHVLCAKSVACILDNVEYHLWCPKHRDQIGEKLRQRLQADEEEKPDDYDDRICFVCKSGLDEEKIIQCDYEPCGRWIHTYCNIPELDEVPEYEFYCFNCVDSYPEIKKY